MKIEEYTALTESIDKGEVRAVYNALKFSAGVLENIGKQLPPDVRREEVEQALYLTWRLCDVVMFHTMPASYWRGPEKQEQRPPVADDDDFITRSSYEDHWQNKGRQFFEDLAKNIREREAGDKVKGVEEDISRRPSKSEPFLSGRRPRSMRSPGKLSAFTVQLIRYVHAWMATATSIKFILR